MGQHIYLSLLCNDYEYSAAGQQGRSFFPARLYVCAMGKPTIKVLYFHRRRTNASGWYWIDYVLQRGKKILHYAISTRDYEFLECLCSSCSAERREIITYMAGALLDIHKVKYSDLKITLSYAYATSKYKPRIMQMCKKNRFDKADVICEGL